LFSTPCSLGTTRAEAPAECPGYGEKFVTIAKTFAGFKDLAVSAKNLIEKRAAQS
jgi:hypothetical protein